MIQTPIKPALSLQAVVAFDMAQVEADQIGDLSQIASDMFADLRISYSKRDGSAAEVAEWTLLATVLSVIEDKARGLAKACDSDSVAASLPDA